MDSGGRRQPFVFLGTHVACLVDEKHRDAVLDPVGLAKPGVVEQTVDEQQRPTVGGAHQDVEQGGVHDVGYGVTGVAADGTSATGALPEDMPGYCPGLLAPGICPAPITALFAFCPAWACCRISI